jgi:peptide/nickel transport system permease protein
VLSENPSRWWRRCCSRLFVLLALAGRWIAPHDPLASNVGGPCRRRRAHWFGTDALGRDILSRVLVATRLDLVIALSAVAPRSSSAARARGLRGLLRRLAGAHHRCAAADMVMSFPLFVLAMGIVAALGNTVFNIIMATAVVNMPFYIRVARTEVNVRRKPACGSRPSGRQQRRTHPAVHLIPNMPCRP